MPKAKLTFAKSDRKKLIVAANFSNVTLGDTVTVGNDLYVETSYRDAQSLVKMIELKNQVTGDELDSIKPQSAKK
jgi:hypothetical protein